MNLATYSDFARLVGRFISILVACQCVGCREDYEEIQGAVSHNCGPVFIESMDSVLWVRHDFRFRNPSTERKARLALAGRSCGCAKCEIHETDLAPGQETEITLAFELRFGQEIRREHAVISTGLLEVPSITLTLSAAGYPRLIMSPDRPLCATAEPGQEATLQTTFIAFQPATEQTVPFQVECHGSGLDVKTRETASVLVDGQVRRLQLTLVLSALCPPVDDETFGSGQYAGTVEVRHGSRALIKRVAWSATPFVRASPRQVFLHAGALESEVASVRLTADVPFTVNRIEADTEFIKCIDVEKHLAREHTIDMHLNRTQRNSLASTANVWIYVEHPQPRVLKIPVFVLW